jgi:hypothetical protein
MGMFGNLLTVIAFIPWVAQAQYEITQCYQVALIIVPYDDIENYDRPYRNDSVYTLSETGHYHGPDGIAEYINFRAVTSPYVASVKDDLASEFALKTFDPVTGICQFVASEVIQLTLNPDTARNTSFHAVFLVKVYYDISANYIPKTYLYFTPEFLDFFFGIAVNTRKTLSFICEIMRDSCPDVYELNGNPTMEECVQRLTDLPVTDEGGRVDGNSSGCRTLHTAFASLNPQNHCAHLSFVPQNDSKGILKCQTSNMIEPTNLFDDEDFAFFNNFLNSTSDLVDANGFRVHYLEEEETPTDGGSDGSNPSSGSLLDRCWKIASVVVVLGFSFCF